MLNRIRQFGLQLIILGSFLAVLLATMAIGVTVVPSEVQTVLGDDLVDRGQGFLKTVCALAAPAMHEGKTETAQAILSRTHTESLGSQLTAAALYLPLKENPSRPDFTHAFAEEFSSANDESHLLLERAKVMLQKRTDTAPLSVDGHAILTEPVTILSTDLGARSDTVGYAVAVVNPDQVDQRVHDLRRNLLGMFAIFGVVVMFLVFGLAQLLVLRPLRQMRELASRVAGGDLTGRIPSPAPDELGVTAESLNQIAESLNTTVGKVKGVSDGMGSVMQNLSRSSEVVGRGAIATQESVGSTSGAMEEMIVSLRGIGSNVEVLAQSAEESSSSILEMAATNDEVAENIVALAASVEETTSAIEQMTFSIREVNTNVEDLSASTEETSSSMNEMDVSIGQVEMNANETSKLAELVSGDAQSGAVALKKTMEGIEKIKDSSRTAAQVIDSLGRKILTIGNILNVIDDVAEQTNLLALNAAIIAAQAGEHGKGFAVVADEIKDLAERTGASTKEIADLIKSVQDESRNAVGAMERGVKSVDEGVRLGTEAEGALKKILESSNKASQMVKAIARATVEQSRGSKQVTTSINRIAETVQQIAKATAEQAKGSDQIMKSAEKMKVITKHVERSSQEQSRGSKQITKSIESINEMVSQIHRSQREQTKGSESVLSAMESIKRIADTQQGSMRELDRAIQQIAEQGEVLRAELRRFRV